MVVGMDELLEYTILIGIGLAALLVHYLNSG